MANRIVWTTDEITPRMNHLGPKIIEGVRTVLQYHEPKVQSYARANASWNDRTSNARNGLMAKVYTEKKNMGIVLFHSVPYGIWLEVRFSGRYAIIIPTIRNQGPIVMRTIGKLLSRIT